MIYRVLFVLLVGLVCCIPCDAFAGPLGLFQNFRPFSRVAARRAEGRGVGQANGPVRRAVFRGSCGRAGCN